MLDTATRILRSILLRLDINNAFLSYTVRAIVTHVPYTGKLHIVRHNYVILSQVNLLGAIFLLQNFEMQSRLETKHQVHKDPRQMQQLSRCLWKSFAVHQSTAAPSLGTAGL